MVRIDEFIAKLIRNKSVGVDSSFFIYHLENIKPYSEFTSRTHDGFEIIKKIYYNLSFTEEANKIRFLI
ncbi:MAG: hypothetical protein PHR39_05770 [Actinomycetota bacterium]|nr:hypothetical protein [Actinomycetota bacterium]